MTAALFTGSTAFANPAVTFGRAFTDTPAGIRPIDIAGFIAAQLLAVAVASPLFKWLVPDSPLVNEPEVKAPTQEIPKAQAQEKARHPGGPVRF
jgi:glycerol uptake facilitator-like aquaporin